MCEEPVCARYSMCCSRRFSPLSLSLFHCLHFWLFSHCCCFCHCCCCCCCGCCISVCRCGVFILDFFSLPLHYYYVTYYRGLFSHKRCASQKIGIYFSLMANAQTYQCSTALWYGVEQSATGRMKLTIDTISVYVLSFLLCVRLWHVHVNR